KSSGEKATASSIAQNVTVTVTKGPLRLLDTPVSFPSPFNPERDKKVTLQYTLSKDTNIDLIIMKESGEIVKRITIQAGQDGGVGQVNKVSWDGITNKGVAVGNGLYVVNIISRDDRKVLGRLKVTVFR
ncbi:MAG: hypothetical protein KJ732_04665, partial [Candidatus Margulisbacteria bacterium]|nr:hypothetical protein [Candidatus Margulisiibacteriota bacterium]